MAHDDTLTLLEQYKVDMPINLEGWLTVPQAARLSGYSQYYIRKLLRENRIEGHKIGQEWLVKESDLLHYKAEMDALGTAKFDRTRASQPDDPLTPDE